MLYCILGSVCALSNYGFREHFAVKVLMYRGNRFLHCLY